MASVVRPMRRERFPVSRGRAGVEEIVGFAGSFSGSGEWCGYAFGFPDRHPRLGRVRFSGCPRRDAVGLWAVGRFRSGAWWFENWIVDASNAMACFLPSFALSRFRQALLFGVWFRDRSFCDHCLQCDDLSSGVEKLIIRFFRGVCRPEGRMVDALADSTDEGRLRMR